MNHFMVKDMPKQRGAALIVVLSMLTASLMLGLVSMQSSMIDERLAGNYKAAAQAQMGAEKAASAGWQELDGDSSFVSKSHSDIEGMSWGDFVDDSNFGDASDSGDNCASQVACHYRYIVDGGIQYIVAMGSVQAGGKTVAESQPVFVKVDVSGFGVPSTTVFPGGIAADADVQWPNSKNSKMSGGYIDVGGASEKVYALSLYEADGGLSAQDIMGGINGNNKTGLSLEEGEETLVGQDFSFVGLVDILQSMYETYVAAGGSAETDYPDIYFYENGLDVTGNTSLEGLHVILNGEVRIGGNADLSGMLVVLNVDADSDEWVTGMATRAKFNGGGNKGTVWFDEDAVTKSISPFGITVEDLLGFNGGGASGEKEMEEWY
ncbi:PilX N-terminal domain-containing pilus assembly protein [Halomonas sp. I5-271120]|uniref:pilus assembly PilX family protein n=1 Tax=Halomonas sp. I5-271120 TaxID=3061632 RepID=UPI0027145F3A|nr:PilX N-terminal domain-containing pilus assembly protein [Halomonas sp. I5-271120]